MALFGGELFRSCKAQLGDCLVTFSGVLAALSLIRYWLGIVPHTIVMVMYRGCSLGVVWLRSVEVKCDIMEFWFCTVR